MMKRKHTDIIDQVPPDYYQKGIKENIFQRLWHSKKKNVVLSLVSDKPKRILDVGCASGWFLSKVGEAFPKASLHGIDIYKEAIDFGKCMYPSMVFMAADAHDIPYKKDSFDLVICTEVLEHVDNPKKVVMEIKRVLRKNGSAVIELDSGSVLFSVAWFVWRRFRGKVWKGAHLHSFTPKKLEKMIEESGMLIERKKTFNLGMAIAFSIRK